MGAGATSAPGAALTQEFRDVYRFFQAGSACEMQFAQCLGGEWR